MVPDATVAVNRLDGVLVTGDCELALRDQWGAESVSVGVTASQVCSTASYTSRDELKSSELDRRGLKGEVNSISLVVPVFCVLPVL